MPPLVVCETLLNLNGFELEVDDAELVVMFEDLAAGAVTEEELAEWLRERVRAG